MTPMLLSNSAARIFQIMTHRKFYRKTQSMFIVGYIFEVVLLIMESSASVATGLYLNPNVRS
jgi:hypothetical protein